MAAGDDSAEGIVRLMYSDASKTNMNQAERWDTSDLDHSTDPRQLPVVAYGGQTLRKDDLLIMEFMPTAGATTVATDPTQSATHSIVKVPATFKNVTTGNKFSRVLTSNDFNSVAANYTCGANAWTVIGTFTVGAQEEVKLGNVNPVNSRIYIDLLTSA